MESGVLAQQPLQGSGLIVAASDSLPNRDSFLQMRTLKFTNTKNTVDDVTSRRRLADRC